MKSGKLMEILFEYIKWFHSFCTGIDKDKLG